MKSLISWRIENRVLHWRLAGHVPATELCDSMRFIYEVANHTNGRLHVIINACSLRSLENKNNNVRNAFRAVARNPKMGKVAAIVPNLMMQVQFNALSNSFGLDWRYMHDLNEAQRYLEFCDVTLVALQKVSIEEPVRRTTTLSRLATQQVRVVPETEEKRRTELLQRITKTQEIAAVDLPKLSRRTAWVDHTETYVTTT